MIRPVTLSRLTGAPAQLVAPWAGFSCGWVTTVPTWMLFPGAWPSTELLPSWQPPVPHKYNNPLVPIGRGCEPHVADALIEGFCETGKMPFPWV